MSAGTATAWLREFAPEAGIERSVVARLTLHSAKVTLLRWSARAGLPAGVRRALGYHSSSKNLMLDLYARDEQSGPLSQLAELLEHVRMGRFNPDGRRAMRWARPASGPSEPGALQDGAAAGPAGAEAGEDPGDLAFGSESPRSNSAEASEQEEQLTASECDVALAEELARVVEAGEEGTPPAGTMQHPKWGTLHRLKQDGSRTICGRSRAGFSEPLPSSFPSRSAESATAQRQVLVRVLTARLARRPAERSDIGG